MTFRLGTRGSPLALAQSRSVATALEQRGVTVELVPIKTAGDRLAQVSLADFGGKGLFVKEIDEALLEGRIDAAVHSLKDMPAALCPGLVLAAFTPREDPRDVLVTRGPASLAELPPASVLGTSSLRRRVLVLSRRADLTLAEIRGNVETRLQKLARGDYDALLLASAGLRRLGIGPAHATPLSTEEFPPAVGQGILGVEAREGDRQTRELLRIVDDSRTRTQALAERAFLLRLGASCHTPVAGHATLDGDALTIVGLVASLDGRTALRASMTGSREAPEQLGGKLAEELLARGAGPLLEARP